MDINREVPFPTFAREYFPTCIPTLNDNLLYFWKPLSQFFDSSRKDHTNTKDLRCV